ncbi:MAG: ABC transporter ATP-binding protein [Deltaproteobacteria bacterium]|nr:ABC transporter ATP-binding protein [Deltaproteobacteria bacterium]
MSSAVISFDKVQKSFFSKNRLVKALAEIDLQIQPNTFTTIIGPSGCGKTTLLRMCAGLSPPSAGRVIYKGQEVQRINTDVGFVTQDSNLYPWLTMIENIEFPLVVRGTPKAQRHDRAMEFIKMVGLEGFENHYPFELSGGMQKRASIIRTLIYGPDVILMDEPFGPLDAQTRMLLQNQLLDIWSRDKKTILFITHDLVEAIALSDVVVLLSRRPGRIKEIFSITLGRPRNVFEIHQEPGFADLYHKIWSYFKDEIMLD